MAFLLSALTRARASFGILGPLVAAPLVFGACSRDHSPLPPGSVSHAGRGGNAGTAGKQGSGGTAGASAGEGGESSPGGEAGQPSSSAGRASGGKGGRSSGHAGEQGRAGGTSGMSAGSTSIGGSTSTGGSTSSAGSGGSNSSNGGEGGESGGGEGGGPLTGCAAIECGVNADCSETSGAAVCSCRAGYELSGGVCVDIDECARHLDDCDASATCVNGDGGFSCACPADLASNGTGCAPFVHGLDARPTNATCVAGANAARDATPITFQTTFPNVTFSWPVAMVQLPAAAGGGFVIAEQDGTVRHFENAPDVASSDLVVDLTGPINANVPGGGLARPWNWELGLVGLAFHPHFPDVPDFFVAYTLNTAAPGGQSWALRVSRFHWLGTTASLSDEQVLLQVPMPGPIHHAGNLLFDPDGYLLISIGDGDVRSNAQPLDRLLGKILRIDVDGSDTQRGTPYRIPADNPFVAGGGLPEIWAYGFRNPWKFNFDQQTGKLWIGDVGDTLYEEIDIGARGGNYGWPIFEGDDCEDTTGACNDPSLIPPVFTYYHDNYPHSGGGNAIVGGFVYHGSAIPDLQGTYVYADFDQGLIKVLRDVGGSYTTDIVAELPWMVSSLAQDATGELFALPYGTNINLQRIAPHAPNSAGPPALLSATGCIDANDPHAPAPGTIPYDINVASFADGATKSRWFNVPAGSNVTISADGRWQFPVGSVLAQNLSRGGRLIETRLLMHHADAWAGYSYAWNDAQTDATLLTTGKTVTLADGTWTFPGRSDCLTCHNGVDGLALGVETAQLNRLVRYPSTGRTADQLSSLDAIALLDQPLAVDRDHLTPLDDAAASLETKSRSYLHANCSGCHRPDGPTGLDIDFRYQVSLADAAICGVAPVRGDLGIAGAARILPGHPEQSIVFERVDRTGAFQMPPLGRSHIDTDGVDLLSGWISSLAACPAP